MTLDNEHLPVVAVGDQIFARGVVGAIATCAGSAMAAEVARRLNMTRDLIMIRELDLGNPDHVRELLSGRHD